MTTDKTLREAIRDEMHRVDCGCCRVGTADIDEDGHYMRLADAALSVVTEHWNERLEAEAQKLDELAADIDAGRTDRFTNTAALRHAARRIRAIKEGQQ